MSKPEDEGRLRWFLVDDSKAVVPESLPLTPVNHDDLLRIYEDEMRASGMTKEVLTWHLIILDNFIRNYLPDHGMAIMSISQSFR